MHAEWALQRAAAAFLSKALPLTAYFTSIDVGRSKSANEGQLRKLRGVRAGIPDMLIVHDNTTTWIELKAGASLSPDQKTTRDALVANGHRWYLARSVEDVEFACVQSGISLRATLGDIQTRIAEQNARLPVKRKHGARKSSGPINQLSLAQYRRLHAKGQI
jgi:hypothetical protein